MPRICDSCDGPEPQLRSERRPVRCPACQKDFDKYTASGWGLNELVKDRLVNESRHLCIRCGGGTLEDDHFCEPCVRNERWLKEMHRNGGKPVEYENPYTSLLESNDTGVYLTPTLDTGANRLRVTARYHQRMAERGGPRGRQHTSEAAWRYRVSEKLRAKYNEISTPLVLNWWVVKD